MNTHFTNIIAHYKVYLQTLGFAPSTVYNYPKLIEQFCSYLKQQHGIQHIKQVQNKHITNYTNHLQQMVGERTQRAFSSSYLNTQFLALDKFLQYLHDAGMQHAPLPQNYKILRSSLKKVQPLSLVQIQQLYDAINNTFDYKFNTEKRTIRQQTLRVVLNLCYGCGLRKSEAFNLKLQDIDYDKKVLHVRQGKNYKDRYVPIPPKILQELQQYQYEYRICLQTSRVDYLYPFSKPALEKVMPIILSKITDSILTAMHISLHTLRHSIATHLLQQGMTIELISEFLGHKGLTATQLYTHFK